MSINFYIILSLAFVVLGLHAVSIFLDRTVGKIALAVNLLLHLALYFFVSLEYRDLEITLTVMMSSLLVFLLLIWGRVKLFEFKKGKEDER